MNPLDAISKSNFSNNINVTDTKGNTRNKKWKQRKHSFWEVAKFTAALWEVVGTKRRLGICFFFHLLLWLKPVKKIHSCWLFPFMFDGAQKYGSENELWSPVFCSQMRRRRKTDPNVLRIHVRYGDLGKVDGAVQDVVPQLGQRGMRPTGVSA